MDKYRFDHACNSVYEYSEAHGCYLFAGALNGRFEAEFIREYELRAWGSAEEKLEEELYE